VVLVVRSTMADLVYHLRETMTMSQLSASVHLFLRNVLDTALPMNIQLMSSKLVLNLVQVGTFLSHIFVH
jgi:transformation/transcription domain-associated protein